MTRTKEPLPALQGAIKVVSLVERLPAALSDMENAWQLLIVEHAPQVHSLCVHMCSVCMCTVCRMYTV